ncbi:hypothetical protein GF366_01420 [Candidatus Peregrinibacteria bacterium]|nr:hypothetical protein [Candidatus Peregrinibacteria bacterium]
MKTKKTKKAKKIYNNHTELKIILIFMALIILAVAVYFFANSSYFKGMTYKGASEEARIEKYSEPKLIEIIDEEN